MKYAPPTAPPDPIVLSTFAPQSVGGMNNGIGAVPASGTWLLANRALFVPFSLNRSFAVTTMVVYNGGAASGNMDLGIYDTAGAKIASTGSTAMSGTTTLQLISLSTTLAPGQYYMAQSVDNTTAQFLRSSWGDAITIIIPRLKQLAGAFPLPADASAWVDPTTTYWPVMAISRRSAV